MCGTWLICLPAQMSVPSHVDWMCHTECLPSALLCSLRRWPSLLWASIGNICPAEIHERLSFIWQYSKTETLRYGAIRKWCIRTVLWQKPDIGTHLYIPLLQYIINHSLLAASAAYLLPLLELSEHYNGVTFPFPHHPPEVLYGVWKRTLGGNKVVLLSVALSHSQTHIFSFIYSSHMWL